MIFIHGLGGAMFWPALVYNLVDEKTSVLAFNNRGHDKISNIRRADAKGKIHKTLAGSAHEVFTDCADDIQGAVNFCKKQGIKKIILAGHSTGCQKSVYYLAKDKNQKQIARVILLCPISDYADAIKYNRQAIVKAENYARRMIKAGKKRQLLPPEIWPELHDAQRFLSLFTPDSREEIFCYATPARHPVALQKIKIPMLLVFAEKDEYLDRPLGEIIRWFKSNLEGKNFTVKTVSGANHGFIQCEQKVINIIRQWIKE